MNKQEEFQTEGQKFALKLHTMWLYLEEVLAWPLYRFGILKRTDT